MKKRVFIGVLAALMLFAFVACDNSTPVATYKDVSYVSVEQVKDFIVGEPITADGFQIVVNYTTGNPTVISGNTGTIDISNPDAVTATSSIDFKNVNGTAVPVVPCETEYKTVTGVSISGVTSATMNEEVTLAALSDIVTAIENKTLVIEGTPVITFSYDGGSKQYTLKDLEDDNLDVVLSLVNGSTVADTSTDFKADETWAVSLDKYRFATSGAWADEFVPGLSTGLSINVVAKEESNPVTLSSITVTQNADNEVFVVNGDASNTDTVANLEYTVVGSFSDGTTETLTTDGGWTIGILNYTSDSSIASGMNIIVYATKGSDYAEGTFTVKVTTDYATSVEVGIGKVAGADGQVARTWAPGEDILPEQFTYTVKSWASGHDYSKDSNVSSSMLTLPSNDFKVNPRMVPTGYKATSFAVNFEYTGDIKDLSVTRASELSSGITVNTSSN